MSEKVRVSHIVPEYIVFVILLISLYTYYSV